METGTAARLDDMSTTATRKTTKSAANRSALREAVAALNEGRPEDYLALFDPDARLHGFTNGIEDVEDLVRFHAATADTYPDATVTLEDAVAERDRVATRFTWRASQAPGWDVVVHGGAIVRFADGQIVECWNLPTELRTVAA
jgi:predicted SnoaL-like aldol condensation-catalyzing enzyme